MARLVFQYVKFTIAVLFTLTLTACASEQSLESRRAYVSGNTFYDVDILISNYETLPSSKRRPTIRFKGVLNFEENGELRALDRGSNSSVLEGKWRLSRVTNRVELNNVVIHVLKGGQRYQISARYSDVPIAVDGSLRQALVSSPKIVDGFPQEAKYNMLLRKIKSAELAPPPPKPAPVEGAQIAAEAAILIPVCILTAFILCI